MTFSLALSADQTNAPARNSFIECKTFSDFAQAIGQAPGEVLLTSPQFTVPIAWDELVVSWNVPPGMDLKIEARSIYPDHATTYYTLGLWSDDPSRHPRHSVRGQRDADGTVQSDTLVLNRHGGKAQVRLTLSGSSGADAARLKFLGLAFCDSLVQSVAREAHSRRRLTVPVP